MQEAGALLLKEAYPHKYPYDWRTKKPTIFRATDQWFASVAGFRDAAMAAIDQVGTLFTQCKSCNITSSVYMYRLHRMLARFS
jgi:isoleucyl-tRNA synthetase